MWCVARPMDAVQRPDACIIASVSTISRQPVLRALLCRDLVYVLVCVRVCGVLALCGGVCVGTLAEATS